MSRRKEPEYHLPHPLFDSHLHAFHMDEADRDSADPDPVAKSLSLGLVGGLEVAVDEHRFEERLAFAAARPGILVSAGIHPSSSGPERGAWEDRFALIREQAARPETVAVGETGLDFFRDHSPRNSQERAFADHLALAVETGLPVIIHNRDADRAVLDAVESSGCRRGVFHCYSSGPETAEAAIALGFHVSFAGNITYKKTEAMREAARLVPEDRILVETDAPYLSPVPVRGRPNHPGHLGYTLEVLAGVRGDDPADLAETTVRNARALFGPESLRP